MRAYERLLNYVRVYTTSDPESGTHPSAEREFDLARQLVEEMKALGIEDARVDEHCYVYGSIPSTPGCEDKPALGLIAHMDTAPDASGEGVSPILHENYDGRDVTLPATGMVMKVSTFPFLADLKGETLITTDGTTLLGADDKAGVAEILTAAEILLAEGRPHGKLCIAFTPDEEIGRGTDRFRMDRFPAKEAYTVDGGELGEIEYENFNAAAATVKVRGLNIHPGSAKNKMKNAALLLAEFIGLLPAAETPAHTEGYEGFFHLTDMEGGMAKATLRYIIRDHDRDKFEERKAFIEKCVVEMNKKYGEGTVTADVKDQYYNMKEMIDPKMHVIDIVLKAMQDSGVPPKVEPIRGGTDGAQLSFKGLPCPNIFAGGVNFHGPYEFISVQVMEKAMQVIVKICEITAEYND